MVTTERPAEAVRCRELGVRPVLKPLRRSELLECVRLSGPTREPLPEGPAEDGELAALRVLLADDSEDNRFLIRSYLKNSGCALEECEDGASLVRKFQEGAYALVLADVQMPVMDGYEATRAVRAWERERNAARTPILALTAHSMQQQVQKSLDAGCDAHLTKPIQKAALLEAIRRFAPPRAIAAAAGSTAAPPVVVDASLEDIVPGYLENRRKDAGILREALERDDWDRIRVLGHNMKGSGAGYGFAALTGIGAALEAAGLARDADAVRAGIEELGSYLDNVKVRYE
jgi:CheY-like chemotaxis protein